MLQAEFKPKYAPRRMESKNIIRPQLQYCSINATFFPHHISKNSRLNVSHLSVIKKKTDVGIHTFNYILKWCFSIASTELFVGPTPFCLFSYSIQTAPLLQQRQAGRKRHSVDGDHRPDVSSILNPTVQTQAEVTGDHLNCDSIRKEKPQERIGKKKTQKVDMADVFVHPFNTYLPRMLMTKLFLVPTDLFFLLWSQ